MDLTLQHSKQTIHDPDTLDHFHEFSVDAVIDKLQEHGPDLYQVFMELGDASRGITTESVERSRMLLASFSCLLNATSRRAKGIQQNTNTGLFMLLEKRRVTTPGGRQL